MMTKKDKSQLREAIDGLHALQVVHNDLNCKNVIFNDQNVFIIDYGFAKISPKKDLSIKNEKRFAFDL